jgi:hypothetical protein
MRGLFYLCAALLLLDEGGGAQEILAAVEDHSLAQLFEEVGVIV